MKINVDADIESVIKSYEGDPAVLESALGAYLIGQYYGWRVVRLVHTGDTIRKYSQILGFSLKDALPDRTALSRRCRGIRIADRLGAYWAVVRGEKAGLERRLLAP